MKTILYSNLKFSYLKKTFIIHSLCQKNVETKSKFLNKIKRYIFEYLLQVHAKQLSTPKQGDFPSFRWFFWLALIHLVLNTNSSHAGHTCLENICSFKTSLYVILSASEIVSPRAKTGVSLWGAHEEKNCYRNHRGTRPWSSRGKTIWRQMHHGLTVNLMIINKALLQQQKIKSIIVRSHIM